VFGVLTSQKPGDPKINMTNWHALPFELKTLVLKAYIDCVMHEKGDYVWSIDHSFLGCFTSSGWPAHQHLSPAEFGIAALFLVAPELQLEALGLVNKKLRAAAMLDEKSSLYWNLGEDKRELCMWSVMRRQLVCSIPIVEARTYYAKYTGFYYRGLGAKFVNQKIKAASAEYRQYSLRSIDRNLALGRSGVKSLVTYKKIGKAYFSRIRCVRT